ncbi:MAG: hypothetical protein ACJ741_05565 [Pyrinomonadaceae bacterium]
MSELQEQRWSVLSERGREAARLSYADAASLVRSLTSEKVHGLCVITDEAAGRLPTSAATPNGGKPRAGKPKDGTTRRRPSKSS